MSEGNEGKTVDPEVLSRGTMTIPKSGDLNTGLQPRNVQEALELAKTLANSNLVPKDMRGNPADVFLAISHCAELKIGIAQGLKWMMVVNGRTAIWGDLVKSLLLRSGKCENFEELTAAEALAAGKGRCSSLRAGTKKAVATEYTIEMAKKANLWEKAGPWSQHPGRMLQLRARGWHARDVYADVLGGLDIAEEAADFTIIDSPPPPPKMPEPLPAGQTQGAPRSEAATQAAGDKPQAEIQTATFKPAKMASKAEGDRTLYAIIAPDGTRYLTYEEQFVSAAKAAKSADLSVRAEFVKTEKGLELIGLSQVNAA